jgi:hypothetical protein
MSQLSTVGLPPNSAPRSRVDELRLLLAAGLFGGAAIHAAVVPEHLTKWPAASVFFIALTPQQSLPSPLCCSPAHNPPCCWPPP